MINKNYPYKITAVYPHDSDAFTEGLLYDKDSLYESVGDLGKSGLRQVCLQSGKVLRELKLPEKIFAEGIAKVDDFIYQLTWQSQQCFVYDVNTFNCLKTLEYSTEGWGLAYDGVKLIMSDGTDALYFRDPKDFSITRTIKVVDNGKPVVNLNELEYVNGKIFANIWESSFICIIDPNDGFVFGHIDLDPICQAEHQAINNVLNGIAYDTNDDSLLVTGKMWAHMYRLKI